MLKRSPLICALTISIPATVSAAASAASIADAYPSSVGITLDGSLITAVVRSTTVPSTIRSVSAYPVPLTLIASVNAPSRA